MAMVPEFLLLGQLVKNDDESTALLLPQHHQQSNKNQIRNGVTTPAQSRRVVSLNSSRVDNKSQLRTPLNPIREEEDEEGRPASSSNFRCGCGPSLRNLFRPCFGLLRRRRKGEGNGCIRCKG